MVNRYQATPDEAQNLMEFAQRHREAEAQAEAANLSSMVSSNHGRRATRVTIRDGQMTTEDLGTRRTSLAMPDPGRVSVFGGVETSREVAEMMGWAEDDHGPFPAAPGEGGAFSDTGTEDAGEITEAQAQVNEFFDRIEQAAIPVEEFSEAVGVVFDNDGPTPELTRNVAERLGLSFVEAHDRIMQAGREYQAQVNREVEALGMDAGAVFALMGDDAARAAMIDHVNGNPSTLVRLVEAAKRELVDLPDTDPKTFRRITAGMGVRMAHDGQVVLTVPGYGEVSWRAAVQNGWVKVRG